MGNSCCNSTNLDVIADSANTERFTMREKNPSFSNSLVLKEPQVVWETDPTKGSSNPSYIRLLNEFINKSYNSSERPTIRTSEEESDIGPHESLALIPTLFPLIRKYPFKDHKKTSLNSEPGVLSFEDETVYVRYYGEIHRSQACGYGQMYILPENDLIVGSFEENLPHGKCQIYYGNGDYFFGEVVKGQLKHGKMVYSSGEEYEGPFKDKQRSGDGCLVYPDGSVTFATFVNDKPSGQIKIITPDGKIEMLTIQSQH